MLKEVSMATRACLGARIKPFTQRQESPNQENTNFVISFINHEVKINLKLNYFRALPIYNEQKFHNIVIGFSWNR